jgi:glutaconyl-CoA/methylmalonyl-CoA decarboxylase subunit delta
MVTASFSNITNEHITIALVGYFIVFSALVCLVAVFLNLPKLLTLDARRRLRKQKGLDNAVETTDITQVSGEENAAIALALHLFMNEIHDEESNIITIRKVSRTYSPWSSKIYGLNTLQRKKW